MHKFQSVPDLLKRLKPIAPVYCFRESVVRSLAFEFLSSFSGRVFYAVKTNPDEAVIRALYDVGVRSFDVASLSEIKLLRGLFPEAELSFMHPVKSRESIQCAYNSYNVRNFSLDSYEELDKILASTNYARDLSLHLRLGVSNKAAEIDLSSKFGISASDAPLLLRKMAKFANKLGVCFHVGSQCMEPEAYASAIKSASDVAEMAGVTLDVLDIGGGFPSVYPGMVPPPICEYLSTIQRTFVSRFSDACELWCEPGRALVADSASVLVRVELRKGRCLYINEGTYGSLFDAGYPGFVFPVRLFRGEDVAGEAGNLVPFSFYGPTCDGLDFMKGPFYLPSDVKEGDYIEIGQLGAYGMTLRTQFNGFGEMLYAQVDRNFVSCNDDIVDLSIKDRDYSYVGGVYG